MGPQGWFVFSPGGTSLLLPAQPFPFLEWRRTKFHHVVLTQPHLDSAPNGCLFLKEAQLLSYGPTVGQSCFFIFHSGEHWLLSKSLMVSYSFILNNFYYILFYSFILSVGGGHCHHLPCGFGGMTCLSTCLCTTFLPGTHGGQKKASGPMKLE